MACAANRRPKFALVRDKRENSLYVPARTGETAGPVNKDGAIAPAEIDPIEA
jgi:hypothetical protein